MGVRGRETAEDSRHLSGQRPAAVRETGDMKMRDAQPPADLSHRGRVVHPIPHSMKSPSRSVSPYPGPPPVSYRVSFFFIPSLFLTPDFPLYIKRPSPLLSLSLLYAPGSLWPSSFRHYRFPRARH